MGGGMDMFGDGDGGLGAGTGAARGGFGQCLFLGLFLGLFLRGFLLLFRRCVLGFVFCHLPYMGACRARGKVV